MPKIIPIDKNNFINFLYHNTDINISNTSFVENLWNDIPKNLNGITSANKINIHLKNILSKEHKWSKNYWILRGWSDKEAVIKAEEIIRSRIKKPVTRINFRLVLKNVFNNSFNLNNDSFIKSLENEIFLNTNVIGEQEFIQKIRFILNKNNSEKNSTELNKNYWINRGWSEEEAISKISQLQKSRSQRCIEYYIDKGYSEDDAIKELSKYQRGVSYCSKSTITYWLNKGFSKEDAKKIIDDLAKTRSVWSTKYWISQGYDELTAKEKVLEYNAASPTCKKFNNDIDKFYKFKNYISAKNKDRIKERFNKDPEHYVLKLAAGLLKQRSKAEEEIFKILHNLNDKIINSPYLVLIPDTYKDALNTYFFACDGYMETDNGNIIIFEYDGAIFHDKRTDEIRDYQILEIDDRVLGIIRIEETFLNINNKLDILNDAIQKIENSTESRVYLS